MLNQIKIVVSCVLLLSISGCSRGDVYIKADHPYVRKITGDYQQILSVVEQILVDEGWGIEDKANPSVYERHAGGEDQGRDVLFITRPRNQFRIIFLTFDHLNVFVHATADGAEIDLRYQTVSPVGIGTRNEKLAKHILGRIEAQFKK